MDPSRYATSPSAKVFAIREANRESNSRIPSRYARKTFDRPSRYAKAMQIENFINTQPSSFVRFSLITTELLLCKSTQTLGNQPLNSLESFGKLFLGVGSLWRSRRVSRTVKKFETTIKPVACHHQKLFELESVALRCLLAGASFRRREHTKTGNCTTSPTVVRRMDTPTGGWNSA
ncbi:hypothetical protein E3N88_23395 [Mikania micrantha]|uniref:Uncharacterized protein n=1 Tax=Mikania micrantha TaxID=192012 RepID=A0A5N6NDE7_9ASTR|nr:hypothetical protein E3N88_23395 [Mikania micrantha]